MKLKIALLTVFSLIVLIITGCSQSSTNATKNSAESIPEFGINVEVVGEAPIKFTNEDAAKIGPVEIKAAQKDKDVFLEENTYRGITFNDFLNHVGVKDYSVISIEAADGYMQEFAPGDLSESGVGFAWAVNGEKLDDATGPIQFVNHGRGPKHWIKNVSKVTIIK